MSAQEHANASAAAAASFKSACGMGSWPRLSGKGRSSKICGREIRRRWFAGGVGCSSRRGVGTFIGPARFARWGLSQGSRPPKRTPPWANFRAPYGSRTDRGLAACFVFWILVGGGCSQGSRPPWRTPHWDHFRAPYGSLKKVDLGSWYPRCPNARHLGHPAASQRALFPGFLRAGLCGG